MSPSEKQMFPDLSIIYIYILNKRRVYLKHFDFHYSSKYKHVISRQPLFFKEILHFLRNLIKLANFVNKLGKTLFHAKIFYKQMEKVPTAIFGKIHKKML